MKKKDVISFFDSCAPWWDADMMRNEEIIGTILDNGGIRQGISVLDVACGTGVLFPDYLKRGVASVTGIDISPQMARIAREKFPQVKVLCGDVEETAFEEQFDAIMVYNAFPHFPDPARLIEVLAGLVKPGGRLSVAHGMSRAALQQHHAGRAVQVSIDLIHEKELAKLFDRYFDVDVIISDERMYQVSGIRREKGLSSKSRICDSVSPMDELLALMKYTVSHNDAHAQEMAALAHRLKEMGKQRAYERVMDAVADFDMVNAKFQAVLRDLTADDE